MSNTFKFEGMESGGSTANTAWTMGVLGSKVHFIGHIGSDAAGHHFYKDMQSASVDMSSPDSRALTMEIFVLITPDGERTFASRGVTAPLTPTMIDAEKIAQSGWLLIEGYTLLDQLDAVKEAVNIAIKQNTKIALTVSAAFAIQIAFKHIIEDILPYTDLLIANDEEISILLELIDSLENKDQRRAVSKMLNNMAKIITHSEQGATFTQLDQDMFLATTKITDIMDATGAGDAFVAGFLYSYIKGDTKKGLQIGNRLGGKVIQQLGGRLKDTSFIQEAASA